MKHEEDDLEQACMRSEYFQQKYKNVIQNSKSNGNHSFTAGSHRSKFKDYMDKMNVKISNNDLKQPKIVSKLRPETTKANVNRYLNKTQALVRLVFAK